MLRLTQTQINALSQKAENDFAQRIAGGWRSYEMEFPIPTASSLTQDVCRTTASEVWKTCNRSGLEFEDDFIALAFIVLRAIRLGVDSRFIEECVRYFINQAHTDGAAAASWATLQLHELEEQTYYGH